MFNVAKIPKIGGTKVKRVNIPPMIQASGIVIIRAVKKNAKAPVIAPYSQILK